MIITSSAAVKILSQKNWEQYVADLRTVSLLGDPSLFPYREAKIESRVIQPSDILPISKYVLEANIETQQLLRAALLRDEHLDLFDLGEDRASLSFSVEGEEGTWVISPPIVEESTADGQPVLLDGEHRFFLAKQLGLPIRVVWISQVPPQYPVVALPIEWSAVQKYANVPPLSEKRVYRFPTLESFPDISSFSSVKITPENFLYFFYRDLSPVCTSTIRKVGSR